VLFDPAASTRPVDHGIDATGRPRHRRETVRIQHGDAHRGGGGTTTLTRLNTPRRLASEAMATGTVDFFNDTGGYGFINTDDADDDVFFHMEDVGGPDLEEGQEVEFEIQDSPKGPRAANLVRL
jgi:CspA family cold shock protein